MENEHVKIAYCKIWIIIRQIKKTMGQNWPGNNLRRSSNLVADNEKRLRYTEGHISYVENYIQKAEICVEVILMEWQREPKEEREKSIQETHYNHLVLWS